MDNSLPRSNVDTILDDLEQNVVALRSCIEHCLKETSSLHDENIDAIRMNDTSREATARMLTLEAALQAAEVGIIIKLDNPHAEREAEVYAVGDAIAAHVNRDDRPTWCYDHARVAIAALDAHRNALHSVPLDTPHSKAARKRRT